MTSIIVHTDLRSDLGAARDQGPRPTCLAFAASDAHAALRPGWTPLSTEFAFYHAQRRAGRAPNVGAVLSEMLATLRLDGQPEEARWPYLSVTPNDHKAWRPPADVGKRFGRDGKAHAALLDGIVAELDVGRPVILLMELSRAFYKPTPHAVVHPELGEVPEPSRRHAVVAVGHGAIDGERAVLVRNSWGTGWGSAGHGWLTETFLKPRLFAAALLTESVDVSPHPAAA